MGMNDKVLLLEAVLLVLERCMKECDDSGLREEAKEARRRLVEAFI